MRLNKRNSMKELIELKEKIDAYRSIVIIMSFMLIISIAYNVYLEIQLDKIN